MDVLNCMINILAAIIAVEYIDYGFEKKYSGLRRTVCFAAGCLVYFTLIVILNRFTNFEGLLCVFYGLALALYAAFALKGSSYDKIFLSLMWVLNVFFSTFIVYGVMSFYTGETIPDTVSSIGEQGVFYASLAACAVKFIMGRLILRFYHQKGDAAQKEDRLIAGALILILFAGLDMFRLEMEEIVGRERYGRLTCLLICQFVGVLFLERFHQKLAEYRQSQMSHKFRDEMTRELNHWRHDMNGRLEVLYRLQKRGKYEEVNSLLENMCGEFAAYPELGLNTCSEGLNTALMKAAALCREKEICFSYAVLGKPDVIDNIDMERLIWNLLSNGIESCLRSEREKLLDIVIQSRNGVLEIRLENSISESVLQQNPKLQSSKPDSLRHGFGMETIYDILKTYQGDYTFYEEDGVFVQEITLHVL